MNTEFEKEYSKAKSRYHNAQKHLAPTETKFRQQAKKVDSLRRQLEAEEAILKNRTEQYEAAKEYLKKSREVYKPLKHEWIKQKGEHQ
jgi:hypothetical protein